MKDVLKKHYRTFRRFSTVGAINTAIDFAVFFILYKWFGVPVLIAHILAFFTAVVNSFVLNALWTFKNLKRDQLLKQIASFLIISLIGLVLSSLAIFIASFYMYGALAKVLAVFVSLTWNYVGCKFVVFKD